MSESIMPSPHRAIRCSTRRLLAAALAAGLALPTGSATGQTNATFTGGTQNYGATAFDIGRTPINSDSETFNVIVPSGFLTYNGANELAEPQSIDRLLIQDATLNISGSQADLTVNEDLLVLGSLQLNVSGGRFIVPLATTLGNGRVSVANGGGVDIGVIDYTGSFSAGGGGSDSLDILRSDGTGSRLDLSSLVQIDISDSGGGTDNLDIRASNGGVIDLSSVTDVQFGDSFGNGSGRLRFIAEERGTLVLGSLVRTDEVAINILGGTIELGGLTGTERTDITVNTSPVSTVSQLDIEGDLSLNVRSTLSVASGTDFSVGGDFILGQTNPNNVNLDAATVELNGTGVQFFEAASEDLTLTGPTAGNFGIGQLIVGQADQATGVSVQNDINNINPLFSGLDDEAVYLFGANGQDGLRVLGGSTFALGGVNVYSFDTTANDFILLNDLFGPDEDVIAFDQGFLQLSALIDLGLTGDFNGDGFVGQSDLDLVLLNFGDDTLPDGFNTAALPGGEPFDNLIGQNELDAVLLNFGSGTASSTALAVVPEPTSAALLTAGTLALLRRRRAAG